MLYGSHLRVIPSSFNSLGVASTVQQISGEYEWNGGERRLAGKILGDGQIVDPVFPTIPSSPSHPELEANHVALPCSAETSRHLRRLSANKETHEGVHLGGFIWVDDSPAAA